MMQTFSIALTENEYVEILQGGSILLFDCNSQSKVRVVLSESAAQPLSDALHTTVATWSDGWDFAIKKAQPKLQRVWVRADDGASGIVITGVRG